MVLRRSVHCLLFLCMALALLSAAPAEASGGGGGSGGCLSGGSGTVTSACNNICISAAMYQNVYAGGQIINTMFSTINNILQTVEYSFFNGVINGSGFQATIGIALILYVSLYGVMIMFNMSSYRVSEVLNRLIKVAIVYMMTSPLAWNNFNTWVNTPVIGGMNQLIREFTVTAEGNTNTTTTVTISTGGTNIPGVGGIANPSAPTNINVGGVNIGTGAPGLDSASFASMFGSSMTTVFSVQLATAIISLATTGFFGWIIALLLAWSLMEFLLMIIGAILTYAKAIIGLAFLFGIGPIFFIFLLFERSRPIFFGWLSQVLAFALQPVMLFAFLSFYVALIGDAVANLLKSPPDITGRVVPLDFCWAKWFSIPGALWDMGMWRPTNHGSITPQDWKNVHTGNVNIEPINVANVLYFLMICHLGRTFSKFIETLATDIAGGTGPGIVRGGDVAGMARTGARKISGKG